MVIHKFHKCIFFLTWFITIPLILISQEDFNVHRFTTSDGLSHNVVKKIIRDSRGMIWVATKFGINRFDGQSFLLYTEENGLESGPYNDIIEDYLGNFWFIELKWDFSEVQKINVFDPIQEQVIYLDNSKSYPFSFDDVKYIKVQKNNDILIYLQSHKIVKLSKGNEPKIIKLEGQYEFISDLWIFEDPSGNFHFHKKHKNQFIKSFNSSGKLLKNNSVSSQEEVLKDIKLNYFPQKYWFKRKKIRPAKSKTDFILDDQLQPFKKNEMLGSCHVVYDIRRGLFWTFQDDSRKLVAMHPTKGVLYNFNLEGLTLCNQITDLMFDENLVWISTESYGLYVIEIESKKFQTINTPILRQVRAMVKDDDDHLWVKTQNSLVIFDTSNSILKKYENGFHLKQSIIKDQRGMIWVPFDSGMDIYDKEHNLIKRFQYDQDFNLKANLDSPLSSGFYKFLSWNLFQSKDGHIWTGSKNQIFRFDTDGVIKKHLLPDTLVSDIEKLMIYKISEKDDQLLWLVSDKGLFLFDPMEGVIELYSEEGKGKYYLPASNFQDIFIDNQGIYWIASGNAGLIKWDYHQSQKGVPIYEHFTIDNGLPSNIIHGIYEDNQNCLWLSSESGIIQFHKESNYHNLYTTANGVAHDELNRVSHYRDKEGKIYFGGVEGITIFDPNDFKLDTTPSPIHLLSLKKFSYDQYCNYLPEYYRNGKIIFETSEDNYLITFGSGTSIDDQNERYSYTFDNQKNWIPTETHQIKLGNLTYGTHQLFIQKENLAGQRLGVLALDIFVPFPFYLQTWFLAICVFFFLGTVLLRYRYSIRKHQQRQTELEILVNERTEKIREDKEIIDRQRIELQHINVSKSQFFNNIAHELRNPLTLILGPAKILKKSAVRNENFEDLKYINSIDVNGNKLLNLSEEISSLAKLEILPEELNYSSISLFLLMKKIVHAFEGAATFERKEFQLIYNLDKDLYLSTDVPKFEKIVNNLISNAFKYTPQGARIDVTVQSKNSEDLEVIIVDTGFGIHSEDLPFIFKPYYRSKRIQENFDPLDAKGGIGLGLPFAQKLAYLLNGEVKLLETSSKGSTFVFEMPMNKILKGGIVKESKQVGFSNTNPLTDTFTTKENAPSKIYHILLVDDHKDIRKFIQDLLEPYYQISVASNGKEALELLNGNSSNSPFSLMICDVMMPEMDGFQFLEKIKSHQKLKSLPLIFLTGYTNVKIQKKVLQYGIKDYITKPFHPEELFTCIKKLLSSQDQRISIKEEEIYLSSNSKDSKWIKSLEQAVKKNLENPHFDIVLLANELAISNRQLNRKVKLSTGLTPAKYIQEIRLQKARVLLESGELDSITSVSYSVGFKTPTYFAKQFKKRFGRHPSSYLN